MTRGVFSTIWDWGVRSYQEGDRHFYAAVRLDNPRRFHARELQQKQAVSKPSDLPPNSLHVLNDSPSLMRSNAFLMPILWVEGEPSQHYISDRMHRQQRRHVALRDSDIIVQTYPRSGTSWTEQLVLMLVNNGNERVINPSEKNTYKPQVEGSIGKVFLDILFHGSQDIAKPWGYLHGQDVAMDYEQLEAISFRRVFKSHLHSHMFIGNGLESKSLRKREMPPFKGNAKVIYVIRDPRDVALSMYSNINACNFKKYGWPIEAFISLFVRGYTPFGGWKDHVVGWLKAARKYPRNVLVVTYEDNYLDPFGTTRKISQFLGADLSEEKLKNTVHFCSFDRMKNMSRDAPIPHVHTGGSGNWKGIFPQESLALFEEILSDPELGEIGERYLRAGKDLVEAHNVVLAVHN